LLFFYLNSEIIEIQGQSVLLIGFLAKNNSDIRDYLIAENVHNIVGQNLNFKVENI
jgi:hypothetical protein